MIRAVLFDLGGTLLHYHDARSDDPERPFWRITLVGFDALLRQAAELGLRLPDPDILKESFARQVRETLQAEMQEQRGGSIEGPMRATLTHAGAAVTDQQWDSLRRAFYDVIDGIVFPREGLIQTLESLERNGYRLGLISNTYWAADLHDRHLGEHGILAFFPVRVYSSEAGRIKPHPGIFQEALGQMGVSAAESAYVGDRADVDVQGAQAAGMAGVLIRSPYQPEVPGAVTPDAIIDELPDLLAALNKLEAAT